MGWLLFFVAYLQSEIKMTEISNGKTGVYAHIKKVQKGY